MAIVSYVPTAEAAEKIRPHFEKVESRGHEVPNFLRVLAHSPELLEGFIALNGALGRTKLDPKLRELAYIRASEANSCGYCLQHHKKAGRKAGLDETASERDRKLLQASTSTTSFSRMCFSTPRRLPATWSSTTSWPIGSSRSSLSSNWSSLP